MKTIFGKAAQSDIDLLWEHCVVEFGEAQADVLLDRIYGTVKETIGVFPECGRLRPEFGSGVRLFPILLYTLFYRVGRRRVSVLRILHGRRDLKGPLMSLMLSA